MTCLKQPRYLKLTHEVNDKNTQKRKKILGQR